jgi:DNA-directed RNA polymerase specialized sigma24 family protein
LAREPDAARRILGRIVRRRAIDCLRRRALDRARRRTTPPPFDDRISSVGRTSLPDGGVHDPASCLVAGRIVAWIRRTFSAPHADWFEAHAGGESTEKIALRAGVAPSYVRTSISRLRRALAAALGLEIR